MVKHGATGLPFARCQKFPISSCVNVAKVLLHSRLMRMYKMIRRESPQAQQLCGFCQVAQSRPLGDLISQLVIYGNNGRRIIGSANTSSCVMWARERLGRGNDA